MQQSDQHEPASQLVREEHLQATSGTGPKVSGPIQSTGSRDNAGTYSLCSALAVVHGDTTQHGKRRHSPYHHAIRTIHPAGYPSVHDIG